MAYPPSTPPSSRPDDPVGEIPYGLSPNLLRAQVQAAPDGMLVTSADARILSWNQRFTAMWQISPTILTEDGGSGALEHALTLVVDPATFSAKIEQLQQQPDATSHDEIQLRDGRVFDRYSTPIHTDDGNKCGRLWVFRDVTQRWQAEEESRQRVHHLESIERVEQALQGSQDLGEVLSNVLDVCLEIFASDRAWLLHPCDPEAPSWHVPMERTRDGFPGALAMGVEIPMLPEAQEVFSTALDHDDPVAYGPSGGQDLPSSAAQQFSIQSQITLCVRPRVGVPWLFGMHQCSHARTWSAADQVLFREVGRRLADAVSSLLFLRDLEASERRYRELVEGTSDLIVQLDAAGRFTYVNRLAARMCGLPPELCAGRSAVAYVHPGDRTRTRQAFARWIAAGERGATIETRVLQPGGEAHDILWTINLHYDDRDRFSSIGAIGHDIGERKRAEHERLELERRIQQTQKLESLGVLAGGIAHDFNNLLMAILGNADLALLHLDNDSASRQYMTRVEQAAQRAAELTSQMLAYSGRGQFVVEDLDANHLVREMGHLLQTVISKKAALRFDLTPELPAVQGDANQLRQVAMNLITNASDALADGNGIIAVRSTVESAGRQYLEECYGSEHARPGRFVILEVADTGGGMDAATRDKMFDPFFTTKFTGRGLGLAAVLGIVRGHRGAIRVDSRPRGGTTIRILLPALTTTAEAPEPEAAPTVCAAEPSATVLVVDDDPMVRTVCEAMLGKVGYQVIGAEDGRRALEVFAQEGAQIDLVILDLTMPHMDGAETYRELRRRGVTVPVLLSSGYSEQEAAARFAGEGLAGFLQKPYKTATLRASVQAALTAQPDIGTAADP